MASVMIVEDDPSLVKLYELTFKLKGFDIVSKVNNGQDAIIQFRELSTKPDIIIMDYRMPVKNGLEASREILEMDKKAKIILASADRSIRYEIQKIGLKSFLLKPFKLDVLLDTVNYLLN